MKVCIEIFAVVSWPQVADDAILAVVILSLAFIFLKGSK